MTGWLIPAAIFVVILALPLAAAAMSCPQLEIPDQVQMPPISSNRSLTLADVLAHSHCPELQSSAAQVTFGEVPRAGSQRVLEGSAVRSRLAELISGTPDAISLKIPDRIVVEAAGAMKSCAEIARFVSGPNSQFTSTSTTSNPGHWHELNCAAAQHVPATASLELTKTAWQAKTRRWEFTLRCTHPADCIPFLVWGHGDKPPSTTSIATADTVDAAVPRLVKAGQTVSLVWDQRGIRIVAPVTCLDAGGVGQSVRVRFKNAPGILRAEVLSDGTLRASL
jgi:hypothetical protein